ncbi:hypothetical protein EVAR_66440_1 [Eumeta japonica]|uniref:Uncharacterized protein n=1 Tax=Eumeta variegata TaxID=151549 RepID=A0A4C2A4D7_EUMVA|nr:hypothetical protein EVAR_66440_1 [Eumeta japonica]
MRQQRVDRSDNTARTIFIPSRAGAGRSGCAPPAAPSADRKPIYRRERPLRLIAVQSTQLFPLTNNPIIITHWAAATAAAAAAAFMAPALGYILGSAAGHAHTYPCTHWPRHTLQLHSLHVHDDNPPRVSHATRADLLRHHRCSLPHAERVRYVLTDAAAAPRPRRVPRANELQLRSSFRSRASSSQRSLTLAVECVRAWRAGAFVCVYPPHRSALRSAVANSCNVARGEPARVERAARGGAGRRGAAGRGWR